MNRKLKLPPEKTSVWCEVVKLNYLVSAPIMMKPLESRHPTD